MENKVKCFDVVSSVVREGERQFKTFWQVNSERYKILEQYCDAIDSISDEFEGVSFEVEIDEIKMTISIKLECEAITIDNQPHRLYGLIERSLSFGFYSKNGDTMIVEFVFPSLWERKHNLSDYA